VKLEIGGPFLLTLTSLGITVGGCSLKDEKEDMLELFFLQLKAASSSD
jgi:hypothetical protein